MHRIPKRPVIEVSDRGCGVVSHAGFRLLAYLADRSGVTGGFGEVPDGLRERRSGQAPRARAGRSGRDVGRRGTTISDLAVLRAQPMLFGS